MYYGSGTVDTASQWRHTRSAG